MAIYSILVAFLVTFILSPFVIRFLKKMQFGQNIREDGPRSHHKKAGTPTIGGIIFIIGSLTGTLLFAELTFELIFLLVLTIGYGTIGFLDDYIKISSRRNLGLTAMQKLIAQLVLSIVVFFMLMYNGLDTTLSIEALDFSIDLKWMYAPFLLLLIIGTTNATNLTDGLDGLLTGTSLIAFLAFALISHQLGMSDVFIFIFAFIGSLLAFLFYNKFPAQIFMGDTGSLAIGGALVGISIITKTELFLAVIGAIFVFETLSVIIQVASFKTRKKLVFRMAPIHHHFEEIGWSERRVVYTFYLIGTIFALSGLLIFNL